MWKCKINFLTIYEIITVMCNNKSVYDIVCTYYSQLLMDDDCDNENIININTYETYTSFSGLEFGYFETERGNELESLLHLIEELIFQKGGYNNRYIPLHASAVVNQSDEAILLVGGTHSGKSTLLLYLISKGYDFYADDLVLIDGENAQLKYFPRPLHVRENTMDMFSAFFQTKCIQEHRLSNDSYYVKLSHTEKEPIVLKTIIEVKYNKIENSFVERTGFNKVLNITKNMKGTNIANWQSNMHTFNNVCYYDLKYSDFTFIDNIIKKRIGGIS